MCSPLEARRPLSAAIEGVGFEAVRFSGELDGTLDAFRAAGREVVYTRHGALLPDGRDMIARRRRRDADSIEKTAAPQLWSRGSFEHEVIESLAPRPHELVVDKNASSAFNGSAIDQYLRNMGLETLVLTGRVTSVWRQRPPSAGPG